MKAKRRPVKQKLGHHVSKIIISEITIKIE